MAGRELHRIMAENYELWLDDLALPRTAGSFVERYCSGDRYLRTEVDNAGWRKNALLELRYYCQ